MTNGKKIKTPPFSGISGVACHPGTDYLSVCVCVCVCVWLCVCVCVCVCVVCVGAVWVLLGCCVWLLLCLVVCVCVRVCTPAEAASCQLYLCPALWLGH